MKIDISNLTYSELVELSKECTTKIYSCLKNKEIEKFKDDNFSVVLGLQDNELVENFKGTDEEFEVFKKTLVGGKNYHKKPIIEVKLNQIEIVAYFNEGYESQKDYWQYSIIFKDSEVKDPNSNLYKLDYYDYYSELTQFLPPLPKDCYWYESCEDIFNAEGISHEDFKKYLSENFPNISLTETYDS